MDNGQLAAGRLDQAVSTAGLEATSQTVASALYTDTPLDTCTYTKTAIHTDS